MKLRYFIYLLLFIAAQICVAQPQEKALLFERLTINDGLSQGMVNSIIQDDYGFMWFATNDGLNRFDGRNFTIFKNKVDDYSSIAENFIVKLFKDSKGRIWISTLANGLDLFDAETETFVHFKHNPQNNNSIHSNELTDIVEDKYGAIWILSASGLDRLKINENQTIDKQQNAKYDVQITHIDLHSISEKQNGKSNNAKLTDEQYFRFIIDSENQLWLFNGLNEIICIQILKNDRYSTTRKLANDFSPKTNYLQKSKSTLNSIVNHLDERKIYFLFNDGITCHDLRNKTVRTILPNNAVKLNPIIGILDKNQKLWAVNANRLSQIDLQSKNLYSLTYANPDIEKMLQSVITFYIDLSGTIWMGTNGYGILKHDVNSSQFNNTYAEPIYTMASGFNQTLLLKHGNLEAIQQGKASLVDAFNLQTIQRTNFPINTFIDKENHLRLNEGSALFSIVQDGLNSYWIGYNNLYHISIGGKEKMRDSIAFPNLSIDMLGNLWYCTLHSLVCFNKLNKSRIAYKLPEIPEIPSFDKIQTIYPANDGTIWLGTTNGLYQFKSNTKQWKHHKNILGDAQSLSMNIVFTLCADPFQPQKFIWIGTNGGGLNRLETATGKVKRFGMEDGLPNNVIYGILSDADGDLWMSTNKGLSCYSLKENKFKNYDEKDGLQGDEFNRRAYCKLENNILCFGGMNGFNWFNPRNIKESDFQPKIAITRFTFNNELLDFKSGNSFLQKPIHLTQSIELDASYKTLSIEYCAFDFAEILNNRYRYKLDGFDKDWVEADNKNVAHYTNLDPGTYVFHVQGTNSSGKWSANEAKLNIIIMPPWYMTWWFRTFLFISISGFLYTLYRFRLNKILEIQKVRNNIARDLHDEIGSNLSTISIFSDLAKNPNKSMEEIHSLNEKIFGYAQTSQIAMSDIVWMANTKNDRFENILSRMNAYASEVLEPQNIKIYFDEPTSLHAIQLNMEKRKALYLIFKEAINNLAKYAQASEVHITFQKINSKIKMIIADNGKGFENSSLFDKSHNGNGLLNMKSRAEILGGKIIFDTSLGNGFRIELTFPTY